MNGPTSESAGGLSFEVDRDHYGWLTFDRPDSSVNILTPPLMRELDALLSQLESRIANGQMLRPGHPKREGGRLHCGCRRRGHRRPHHRCRGSGRQRRGSAHLPTDRTPARSHHRRGRRRVHGRRHGADPALRLSGRVRRASTAIGLPEVRLGILPGFGGTVKLPALVGMQNALGIILSGKAVRPSRARQIGLVDRVVPAARFKAAMSEFVGEVVGRQGRNLPLRRSGSASACWRGRVPAGGSCSAPRANRP